MKLLRLLPLLLLAAPVRAQSTFLELGLYWGSLNGAQVTNATTTISNSKGEVIATATGAWPHITLPVQFDMYTVNVKALAANGHPALNYTMTLPLATSVPGVGITVTSYAAKIAFDATGQHGTYALSGGGAF